MRPSLCVPPFIRNMWLTNRQGALLASIIAGALSFPQIENTHWLVHACWYTALTLVVTSVLVGFQQTSGLGAVLVMGDPEDVYLSLVDSKRRAQWKVVFVLQVPVQLLSYAIFLWTIGLSVYVFYPLVRGERGAVMRVGICYAVGLAASMILFIVSSGFSLGLLEKLGERVGKQGTAVREEEGEAKVRE